MQIWESFSRPCAPGSIDESLGVIAIDQQGFGEIIARLCIVLAGEL